MNPLNFLQRIFLLAIISCTNIYWCNSQVISLSLQSPSSTNINPEQLWQSVIITNQLPLRVELSLVITSKVNGIVYTGYTNSLVLNSASTSINYNNLSLVKSEFPVINVSRHVKETGYLPSGTYQYCLQVINSTNKEVLALECSSISAFQFNILLLNSPENKALISTLNPLLTWMPIAPSQSVQSIWYEVKLCEVLPNQTAQDAIIRNRPLLNKNRINENQLLYANDMFPLKYGKKYAWQVIANDIQLNVLAKSEVWEFTPNIDTSELQTISFFKSYIDLNANTSSTPYNIQQSIKVKYSDRNYPGELQVDLLNDKGENIYSFPEKLKVLARENWFEVLLSETKGIKNGQRYTILFSNTTKEIYRINFIYYQ